MFRLIFSTSYFSEHAHKTICPEHETTPLLFVVMTPQKIPHSTRSCRHLCDQTFSKRILQVPVTRWCSGVTSQLEGPGFKSQLKRALACSHRVCVGFLQVFGFATQLKKCILWLISEEPGSAWHGQKQRTNFTLHFCV